MKLVILLLSFYTRYVFGSECGETTIPYSLEVLPSGQPILGCARPTCFGWHPNGHQLPTNAKFFRINQQPDGFLRDDPQAIHSFDEKDPRVYPQQHAICEHEFQSFSCNQENQWVGGIAPVLNVTKTNILAYQCCTYPPLRASTDRGIATVSGGQIVVGGEVSENNNQFAFDYISNVAKKVDEEGEIVYEVNIRRFSCLDIQKADRSHPEILNAENVIRHVNGMRPVLYQAPNVEVAVPIATGPGLAVPAGVVNGQEVIIEEIVAQPGFIVEENTDVTPPPPPPQPQPQPPVQPQGFQPQGFQPQGFQPQGFQPQGFVQQPQPIAPQGFQPQPVAPQGYAPVGYAAPAGLELYFCFPGEAEVSTIDGTHKRMDELEVGDWVQAFGDNGKEVTYVPVQYWLHRDPEQVAEFIEFYLDNGEKFSLTQKHLVYKAECKPSKPHKENINANPVPSENIQVGDCFYIAHRKGIKMYQTVKVLSINTVVKTGIYAPMTSIGHLLVNRLHMSCHSETDMFTLQNSFFGNILRWKNQLISYFSELDSSKENNLGSGLNGLMDVIDLVIPAKLL